MTLVISLKRLSGLLIIAALALPACRPAPSPAPTEAPPPVQASAPAVSAPVSPAISPVATVKLPPPATRHYTYKVVNTYPHDRQAFTQGLIFQDDIFYEGTGLKGQSSLRKVNRQTGEVLQQTNLPPTLFGEGITIWGDKLYQLTWQSNLGFVYNKNTFERLSDFHYPTEGWGITQDGQKLIMSDGTDTLYFWDPETLKEIGRVQVFDDAGPVIRLNELEYVNGEVFANVWQTDQVARIDPQTGRVLAWIDLSGLLSAADINGHQVDVLNGIAYDAGSGRLFVTGKWWPKVFEIELVAVD